MLRNSINFVFAIVFIAIIILLLSFIGKMANIAIDGNDGNNMVIAEAELWNEIMKMLNEGVPEGEKRPPLTCTSFPDDPDKFFRENKQLFETIDHFDSHSKKRIQEKINEMAKLQGRKHAELEWLIKINEREMNGKEREN